MKSNITLRGGVAPWISINGKRANSEAIHLAPANGIPVASYASFIDCFDGNYSFTGMDSRGAWPDQAEPANSFRVESFADDLIEAIETKHSEPVIGMGHSHGGLITAVASIKRPELFSRIVLIDVASAPTRSAALMLRLLPKSVAISRIPFIGKSYGRQRVWQSRQAFLRRYENHPTYRRFSKQAMNDYIQHGLRDRKDGKVELVYHPSWESHVFRTVGFAWPTLRKISVPALLIRAEHSNIFSAQQFAKHKRGLAKNIEVCEIPDSYHLLTHESPDQIAKAISSWLAAAPELGK